MPDVPCLVTLSPRDYDAVLFDLDGVLTQTARVHAAAWTRLFDEFLQTRATEQGEPLVPFDLASDYRRYVDGKPRYDGVAAFLHSRGREMPVGSATDDRRCRASMDSAIERTRTSWKNSSSEGSSATTRRSSACGRSEPRT